MMTLAADALRSAPFFFCPCLLDLPPRDGLSLWAHALPLARPEGGWRRRRPPWPPPHRARYICTPSVGPLGSGGAQWGASAAERGHRRGPASVATLAPPLPPLLPPPPLLGHRRPRRRCRPPTTVEARRGLPAAGGGRHGAPPSRVAAHDAGRQLDHVCGRGGGGEVSPMDGSPPNVLPSPPASSTPPPPFSKS